MNSIRFHIFFLFVYFALFHLSALILSAPIILIIITKKNAFFSIQREDHYTTVVERLHVQPFRSKSKKTKLIQDNHCS